MKFIPLRDKIYNQIYGYQGEGCYIDKETSMSWRGNVHTVGYGVYDKGILGKRYIFVATLKEAKAYAEKYFGDKNC